VWQVYTLPGHSASVSRLEFSNNGAQAISGSDDDTVRGAWYQALPRLHGLVVIINSSWLGMALTWVVWQVRFWDIASGKEVRQVAGTEFAFGEGAERTEQWTNHHFLTAFKDELLITELVPHGGVEEIGDGAAPVASFKAPQPITSVRCHGTTICVGCKGGAVCILQAPFLGV